MFGVTWDSLRAYSEEISLRTAFEQFGGLYRL